LREVSQTPIRVGEKQARAFDGSRGVRIVDSVGRLVDVIREPKMIFRYLSARNAEPVRDHQGQLRSIKLASLADERGKPGERRGSSLVTTERCKSSRGEYIGTPMTLKHKLDQSEG
jgi:hypothetical protein